MNEVQKVIDIALNEVGYIEKKSNSNLDDKTANAGTNNYNKYARDLDALGDFYNTRKNGYDWCDVFHDWCHVDAFGEERALELLCQPRKSTGAGCGFSMNFYKNAGQLFKSPEAGDQIFFANSEGVYHTGLVYKVDNSKVYTVEGNTRKDNTGAYNEVCKKEYALGASYIAGYGRPKYSTSNEEKEEEKETNTNDNKNVLEWQRIMNKTYNCNLAEDNSFGPDCKAKANAHYLHYKIPTIKNEHVKFIQSRLKSKGYNVAVDGSFGPDSEAKTKQFQKANNLQVDGFVGVLTTEKLLK